MSEDFKDFDAEEEARGKSATFKLGGKKWTCRHPDDVPFSLLETLMTPAENGEAGAVMRVAPFFQAALVPEQADAFIAMLREPDSKLTVGKLQPLMAYVSQKVFQRPTEPSKPQSAGRQTTKRTATSKRSSSSEATTPRASVG